MPIAPEPDWVINHPYSMESPHDTIGTSGGYYYCLVDYQTHVEKEEYFVKVAIRVLTTEGIQNSSDIDASYDPEFQSLVFHKVLVHRNGEVIDKLKDHKIRVLQRETDIERHLYNGSLSAILNLSDIRIGDVIEYSYTKRALTLFFKGSMPVGISCNLMCL